MLTSGTKLGPYEIQSLLGSGGMGEVYRAADTRLDRLVAIKVLASHLSFSPELKQRMEREARAISALSHPHVCHLYDVGSQNGTDYLVMEFLEGETLAERLRAQKLVPTANLSSPVVFYDVTFDSKKILMDRVSLQVNQSVTVVTNFAAELKK